MTSQRGLSPVVDKKVQDKIWFSLSLTGVLPLNSRGGLDILSTRKRNVQSNPTGGRRVEGDGSTFSRECSGLSGRLGDLKPDITQGIPEGNQKVSYPVSPRTTFISEPTFSSLSLLLYVLPLLRVLLTTRLPAFESGSVLSYCLWRF